MRNIPSRFGARRRQHRERTFGVVLAAMLTLYACDRSGTPLEPDGATVRTPRPAPQVAVTTGVTTVCKVGPGATFQVQVGEGASTQTVTITDGQCTDVAVVNPTPGDDVIVTVTETPAAYYSLDHIMLQIGSSSPETVTGTNSVSFEGAHGARVTFYNNPVVQLCKDGTAATFQYEVGLGTGFRPIALADGECSIIATIPPAPPDDVIVTIREDASSSYSVDHIALAIAALTPQTITGTREVSFEGLHGAVVTYYNVPVASSSGCTYTQGYYKNKGSSLLPSGAFYGSGQSWLGVLDTPPKKGNPYYILAHQYIAAYVNAMSASTPTSVAQALAAGASYFAVATPSDWSVGGAYTKAQLMGWSNTLDQYNQGTLGPGHCD